jgi:uncharacterized protein YjiK
MRNMKTKLLIMTVLIIALTLVFKKNIGKLFAKGNNTELTDDSKKEKKGKKDKLASSPSEVTIVKQWDLPKELNEVSGIAYIDASRFACVQDEDGIIFHYNTAEEKIEKKFPFAGAGDYEGITLVGNTAYVVRADGMLFEVINYTSAKPAVTTYKTPFTASHNIEGLTYQKKHNRLLLAVKDEDLSGSNQKGVYAFDLSAKKLNTHPVYVVATNHTFLTGGKKKKEVRPSAIAIHPNTGHLYVVDGPQARLLMLDESGKLIKVIELGSDFAKPEGITFDQSGRMFISNEREKKTAANIMEVTY